MAARTVVALVFNLGHLRARLLGRAVPPGIDSLSVLALANLSTDPSQEYFADGIHDALITRLGQLTALKRVIADVRLSGNRVRITVRPDTYDAYLKGTFSIPRRTTEGCAKGLEALRSPRS